MRQCEALQTSCIDDPTSGFSQVVGGRCSRCIKAVQRHRLRAWYSFFFGRVISERSDLMCVDTTKLHTAHHFEFWGPHLGPVTIIVGLPVVTFLLQWYVAVFTAKGAPEAYWLGGALVVCCWLLGITALHWYSPGKPGVGVKLSTGQALPYKLNGEKLVILPNFWQCRLLCLCCHMPES